MNYASVEISLLAALPAVILAAYVFIKDRVEKEPLGFLSILFFSGAVVYIPVHFARNLLMDLFDSAFASEIEYSIEGAVTYLNSGAEFAHKGLGMFIAVALLDELVKWLLIYFVTRKSKHFNCLFDGLVYACFVSLGFAAAENVAYAWINGWDTLLIRSVSSVPAHLLFGIVMGYFYTIWHMYYITKTEEKKLSQMGLIAINMPFTSWYWLFLSIFMPVFLHGIYGLSSVQGDSKTASMIFYLVIFAIYVICFIAVNKISNADSTYKKRVVGLLKSKYPQLSKDEKAMSLLTGEGDCNA